MAKNLFYLSKASLLLIIQLLLIQSVSFTNAKRIPEFSKYLKDVEESQKGQRVQGLREVKHYLNKFGYISYKDSNKLEDDEFDEALEAAIKTFQTFFHLKVTGKLDKDTIKQMSIPRCGVPDIINGSVAHPLFTFFPGTPKWPNNKHYLKYALESSASPNVDLWDILEAFLYAFGEWERFSDFKFEFTFEVDEADLVLGFHRLDHGDGHPFDGPGGDLAHAFAPTDGRLHFDADEFWSISNPILRHETDLMAVSLHEIGHLLGLGHSTYEPAIMYPSIATGQTKRGLSSDDMTGILTLYSG